MSDIWGYIAARQAQGESTIRESLTHDLRTKFLIPLGNWTLIIVGGAGLVGGAWLCLNGMAGPYTRWAVIRMILGPVLSFSSYILCRYGVKELFDPYWKMSPFERMIAPALAAHLRPPEPSPANGSLIPYRRRGDLDAILTDLERPTADHLPPPVAELLDFVIDAHRVGLSREVWLKRKLPSTGREVDRPLYDAFIDWCATLGIVQRGGWGRRTRWTVRRREAIARIERAIWRDITQPGGAGQAGHGAYSPPAPR